MKKEKPPWNTLLNSAKFITNKLCNFAYGINAFKQNKIDLSQPTM